VKGEGGAARLAPSAAAIGAYLRLSAVGSLVLLSLAGAATESRAQAVLYPTKSIRMIIAAPVETPVDYAARIIARGLAEAWGQPVLVDNRATGDGVTSADLVSSAQPDGHTLLVHATPFVVLPLLYKVPYDSGRDFVPVARIASSSLVLVVHPPLAASSVKELIALAGRRTGGLGYASHGRGSVAQLAGDLFRGMAAPRLSPDARPGVPEAMGAVMSGQAQMMFAEIAYALPHVESGALRALATTGSVRSPLAPTLPTVAESGVKGYEFALWFGAFAPAGTPGPVVQRIAVEIGRLLEMPGMERRFAIQGFETAWLAGAEFQHYLRAETKKFAGLMRKGEAR
jgi:tripartite-type tricarboxylate transporter receptor subunit TctC